LLVWFDIFIIGPHVSKPFYLVEYHEEYAHTHVSIGVVYLTFNCSIGHESSDP
jgi:hypothetical protein